MQANNLFDDSPEHIANRRAAWQISVDLIALLEPEQVPYSELLLDDLITEAGRGRAIPRGSDYLYAEGALDLKAQVIVPAVVSALTAAMTAAGITSVLLLASPGAVEQFLSTTLLKKLEQKIGISLSPKERTLVLGRISAVAIQIIEEMRQNPAGASELDLGGLESLLQACTVLIRCGRSYGTGFFVAPSLVLTCEHVVAAGSAITVVLQDGRASEPAVEQLSRAHDAALLRVPVADHPIVLLGDDIHITDTCWTTGYEQHQHTVRHTAARLDYEGELIEADQRFLKLRSSQIVPGMSGSALLNLRNGLVVGLITRTRHPSEPHGGYAIPTRRLDAGITGLIQRNQEALTHDPRWKRLL